MRRLPILLVLLLCGCAGAGVESEETAANLTTGSIAPAPAAPPPAELNKTQQRAIDSARKLLQAYLADKGATCSSSRLRDASTRATDVATAFAASMRPEYDALLAAGAHVLDVADAARGRGCHPQAKRLYDFVLKNYAGVGYASLRDRATTGSRNLQAAS